jgi:hypothetical protein
VDQCPVLGTSRSYVERGSEPSLVGRSGHYRNIAPQRGMGNGGPGNGGPGGGQPGRRMATGRSASTLPSKGSRPALDRKPRNVKGLPDPQWSGAQGQSHGRSLTGTPAGACVPLHRRAARSGGEVPRTTREAGRRAGAWRRGPASRLRCPSRRGPGSRARRRQGRVPPYRSGGRASGRDRDVGR